MKSRQDFEQKSRLGRLLVNRGYLSEDQLNEGLRLQRESGDRLGELFVKSGWITERDLQKVLKHQARYRNAAALVTMVVLPFQPMISFAAGAQANNEPGRADAAQMVSDGQFKPMTDQDMAGVSAQGDASIFEQFAQVGSMPDAARGEGGSEASDPDVIKALKLVTGAFIPALNFLDSELTISGVHYAPDEPRFAINSDGGLKLALPERIEQIRMDNIRVGSGPSMGNVTISDVRFHSGSSMTVYTR